MTSSKMTLEQIRDYLMENTDLKYFEIHDIFESIYKIMDSEIENNDSYQEGYDDGFADGYDKRCDEL